MNSQGDKITEKRDYKRYLIFLLFIIIVYLSFLVIRPFINAILMAFVVAYICYPLFKAINRKLKHREVASVITAVIIVILVAVPSALITTQLSKEIFVIYLVAKQSISTQFYSTSGCTSDGSVFCDIGQGIANLASNPRTKYFIQQGLDKLQQYSVDLASGFIVSIPKLVLNVFITIFIMYYLFKQGKTAVKRLIKSLPFRRMHSETITRQFSDVVAGVLYGTVLTAIVQGIVAAIGYAVFGVPSPLLWGVITGFFAMIPFVGTPIIWIPAALFQIINGFVYNDNTIVGKGVLLLVYGTFVISLIDNFIKPKLIGDKANVHPVTVLLGVLGGVMIFGAIGVVIGPLILALFSTFIKIYEFENLKSKH